MSRPVLSRNPQSLVELWLVNRPKSFDSAGELVDRFKQAARQLLPSCFPNKTSMYNYALRLKMQREHLDAVPALFGEYYKFVTDYKYGTARTAETAADVKPEPITTEISNEDTAG